jgi:two-component system, sensor histidine kinase and response regulator
MKPVRESELLKVLLAVVGGRVDLSRQEAIKRPLLRPNGRKLRVLVAEDNAVNQRLAVRLLEKFGHVAAIAGNGLEAVKAVQDERFDLLLMDVQMPEMDGFQASMAIREWERSTGTHQTIVAMTAHAMKGDEDRCLAAGMDGYIPKPIEVNRLRECLEDVESRCCMSEIHL